MGKDKIYDMVAVFGKWTEYVRAVLLTLCALAALTLAGSLLAKSIHYAGPVRAKILNVEYWNPSAALAPAGDCSNIKSYTLSYNWRGQGYVSTIVGRQVRDAMFLECNGKVGDTLDIRVRRDNPTAFIVNRPLATISSLISSSACCALLSALTAMYLVSQHKDIAVIRGMYRFM